MRQQKYVHAVLKNLGALHELATRYNNNHAMMLIEDTAAMICDAHEYPYSNTRLLLASHWPLEKRELHA